MRRRDGLQDAARQHHAALRFLYHVQKHKEFYRVAFRKKVYESLAQLQADADAWVRAFNEGRPHQDRWCFGKTPMQTWHDSVHVAKEKNAIGDGGQTA